MVFLQLLTVASGHSLAAATPVFPQNQATLRILRGSSHFLTLVSPLVPTIHVSSWSLGELLQGGLWRMEPAA